jgi:hypothetical protein
MARTMRVYRRCIKYLAVQSVSDTGYKDAPIARDLFRTVWISGIQLRMFYLPQ